MICVQPPSVFDPLSDGEIFTKGLLAKDDVETNVSSGFSDLSRRAGLATLMVDASINPDARRWEEAFEVPDAPDNNAAPAKDLGHSALLMHMPPPES